MIGVWIFMLIMLLVMPITMIILGTYLSNHVPEKINATFGYRTKRAMRNKDTWNFANHYGGQVWRRIGIVSLPATIAAMIFCFGKGVNYVGCFGLIIVMIQIIFLIMTVFFVESALKKYFDEKGKKR